MFSIARLSALFSLTALCLALGCASTPTGQQPPGVIDQGQLLERTRTQLQWANEQLENYRLAFQSAKAQSTDPRVIEKLDALSAKVEKVQAVAHTAQSVIVPPAQPGAPPTIDWDKLSSVGGLLPWPGNLIALVALSVIGGIAKKKAGEAATASAATTIAAGHLDDVLNGVENIVGSIEELKKDPDLWAKVGPLLKEAQGPQAVGLVSYARGKNTNPALDQLRKLAA